MMRKKTIHTLLATLLALFIAGCTSQPSVSQATAEKIEQKLATVASLKGSQIKANKSENAIILTGYTKTKKQKYLSSSIARSFTNGGRVINDIKVQN
jgi:outer membrane lipoprotein-sorting protein